MLDGLLDAFDDRAAGVAGSGHEGAHGFRIPVSSILGYMAAGMTTDEILADFPQLSLEDLEDVVGFAKD